MAQKDCCQFVIAIYPKPSKCILKSESININYILVAIDIVLFQWFIIMRLYLQKSIQPLLNRWSFHVAQVTQRTYRQFSSHHQSTEIMLFFLNCILLNNMWNKKAIQVVYWKNWSIFCMYIILFKLFVINKQWNLTFHNYNCATNFFSKYVITKKKNK